MFKRFKATSRRKNRHAASVTYGQLEGKRLLAGNVTVVNTDNLYIRGDNADNQIEIIGNEDGSLSIMGLEGTTINGSNDALTIAGGDIGDSSNDVRASYDFGLRANVGQGDDFLLIEGVEFKGSSIVYGGPGNDSIGTFRTNFSDRLLLQTFTGDDNVSMDTSSVGGDLYVRTLDGEDTVWLDRLDVEGNAFVVGGNNDDSMVIDDSSFAQPLLTLSQNGNDFISVSGIRSDVRTGIFAGDGDDQVSINFSGVSDSDIPTTIIGGQAGNDLQDYSLSLPGSPNVSFRTFEGNSPDVGQDNNSVGKTIENRETLFDSGARMGNIFELAGRNPGLSTLAGAVKSTNLAPTLENTQNLTVFAPTNAAFDKLPEGTLEGLTDQQLTDILTFHVSGEVIREEELVSRTSVDTLLGTSFSVSVEDDGVILNDNVTIAATNIRAKNGVIHVLNEVLLPPADG